ncbi:MAG: hypothetical protein DRR00_03850 [Candidatus Parabeggiatoa sp. nov. 3]|nr:MAG: hypothetical protein DRR00_03850 [Gammaproteobacteria bacterium]
MRFQSINRSKYSRKKFWPKPDRFLKPVRFLSLDIFLKAAAINRAMQQRSLVAQVAQVAKILQMNRWTFEQNYI